MRRNTNTDHDRPGEHTARIKEWQQKTTSLLLRRMKEVNLAVARGLAIRKIWLRILALSHTSCVHSFIYACVLDAIHMPDTGFGSGGTTATRTEKEEQRETTCFISVILCQV